MKTAIKYEKCCGIPHYCCSQFQSIDWTIVYGICKGRFRTFNVCQIKKELAVSTVVQEHVLIEGIRSEMPDVVAIYLFGSAAAGELRADSDIDLAVLPNASLPVARRWSLAQALAVSAGRDVDLVDLRSASTVMRAQVVSTGKRLYCANKSLCSEFEDRVYSDYARLNEERQHILDDIRERGRIYG